MRSIGTVLFVSISTFAFAQTIPPGMLGFGVGGGSVGLSPPSPAFSAGPISTVVVTGEPYSAEGESQNIQTLGDGTHISTPLLYWKFYRDSQGRTRIERPVALGRQFELASTPQQIVIEINDPIAQLKYVLDPIRKVVHKQHWVAPTSAPTMGLTLPLHGATVLPPESLGTRTIEGVNCEGTRNTTVWPVGTIGNDRALSQTNEIWKSSELQLTVLTIYSNPQTGVRTQKLVNIVRAEPAASLFQPPTDYTMEDYSTETALPIGNGVSAPTLLSKAEPEYSEQARQAKYSGTVLLSIVVDPNGMPRDIKVVRPLGMGLDEKAIEAVSKWRFRPGIKDGIAVPVRAQVEVSFRM